MSEEKKQPKQRLNVRVRRGLSLIHHVMFSDSPLDFEALTAKQKGDYHAALRWIAENKQ